MSEQQRIKDVLASNRKTRRANGLYKTNKNGYRRRKKLNTIKYIKPWAK